MADSGTIRDFMVGIGFKVDQTSQQQFTKGVAAANQNVKGLQTAATGAGQAIQRLGQHFKAAADEPVRKFAEGTRRIGLGMEGLRKGTIELGRVALATGGAFAAGIIEVTKNFQELYYTAQRVGTTVEQLVALRFASEQAGMGADALAAGMEALNQAIIEGGQPMENFVNQFLNGQRWSELKDKSLGYLEVLKGLVAEYRKGGPEAAQALAKARAAHIDVQKVIGGAAVRPGGELAIDRQIRLYKEAKESLKGVPIDEFAEAADRLNEQLVKIKNNFYAIFVQGAMESMPGLERMTKAIKGWLDDLKEYNKTHPEAAQLESFAAAAVGVASLDAAIYALTGRMLILNPAFLVFAGAAAAIIANWDTIGPFLKRTWDKIEEDIRNRNWEKLGTDLGEAIKQGFLGVGGWADSWFDSFTKSLEGVNTEEFSKKLRDRLAGTSDEMDITLDDLLHPPFLRSLDRLTDTLAKKGHDIVHAFLDAMLDAFLNDPDVKRIRDAWNWLFNASPDTHSRGAPGGMSEFEKSFSYAAPGTTGEEPAGGGRGRGRPSGQHGGIITANLHEGEMVLPAPISRGLQALIAAGQSGGGQEYTAQRGMTRLGDWLTGIAGSIPRVMVTNWKDMIDEQKDAMIGQPDPGKIGPPDPRGPRGGGGSGGGGGGGGGGGDGGDGVPDTSDPNLVGSEYLKSQRARFAKEMEENPEEKLRFAALLKLEDPANRTAMPESLMNRMAMTGRTLMDPRGGMMGGPTGSEHPSFYGPQRKGQVEAVMEQLRRNPQLFNRLWRHIQGALGGSNVTGMATDQGNPGDPNYGSSNIIFPNKEGYGPWGGFKGVPYSREWARKQQEQVDRMKSTTIGPGASLTRGVGGGNGGDKNLETHVTNNITINGASDPHETAKHLKRTQERMHADLIRNLKPALV